MKFQWWSKLEAIDNLYSTFTTNFILQAVSGCYRQVKKNLYDEFKLELITINNLGFIVKIFE